VAIVHPTSLWKRQQYTLGAVDVQCFRPENRDVLASAAQRVATEVRITIGSVDMSGDHPVFAPVHEIMRAHLVETPFAVRLRLSSERDKQYALILSDLPAPRALS